MIDGQNKDTVGQFIDWKLTLWGEIAQNFSLPPSTESNEHKVTDIGVDDFENSTFSDQNKSFLDQNESNTKGPSFAIYGLVSVFIVASLASTAFIVKKYMLFTPKITYTRPTEEDAFEFDNLISNDGDDIFGDESEED